VSMEPIKVLTTLVPRFQMMVYLVSSAPSFTVALVFALGSPHVALKTISRYIDVVSLHRVRKSREFSRSTMFCPPQITHEHAHRSMKAIGRT